MCKSIAYGGCTQHQVAIARCTAAVSTVRHHRATGSVKKPLDDLYAFPLQRSDTAAEIENPIRSAEVVAIGQGLAANL
jgi:hypothetical protein